MSCASNAQFSSVRTSKASTSGGRHDANSLAQHCACMSMHSWNAGKGRPNGVRCDLVSIGSAQIAGRAPILNIQAENDPVAPRRFASALLKDSPGARMKVVVVPNGSHALVPEQPAAAGQGNYRVRARFQPKLVPGPSLRSSLM